MGKTREPMYRKRNDTVNILLSFTMSIIPFCVTKKKLKSRNSQADNEPQRKSKIRWNHVKLWKCNWRQKINNTFFFSFWRHNINVKYQKLQDWMVCVPAEWLYHGYLNTTITQTPAYFLPRTRLVIHWLWRIYDRYVSIQKCLSETGYPRFFN